MRLKLPSSIRGNHKYFILVAFLILLTLAIGIISPRVIESKQEQWQKQLAIETASIERRVRALFSDKEKFLLSKTDPLKEFFRQTPLQDTVLTTEVLRYVTNTFQPPFSVQVYNAEGERIAWNDEIVPLPAERERLNAPGTTFFHIAPLKIYTALIDTVVHESGIYTVFFTLPIEKRYSLRGRAEEEVSFTAQLERTFETEFDVDYHPYAAPSKDGRLQSIEILNNANEKIGLVTFTKPLLKREIAEAREFYSVIQAALLLLAFLLLAVALRHDFRKIKYRFARFLLFAGYLSFIRWMLFQLDVISAFFEGSLIDAQYFSSTFGAGIVKSPAEFLVTNFFFLAIGFYCFILTIDFYRNYPSGKKWLRYLFPAGIVPVTAFILLSLRALSAAMKSVIFDSTLRYFKMPEIIPNLPVLVMNIAILMLGLCALFILVSLLTLLLKYFREKQESIRLRYFLLEFFIIAVSGILFIVIHPEPLFDIYFFLLGLVIIFLVVYAILFWMQRRMTIIIYTMLAASIITVAMMNRFNSELERDSLKITAFELNRPNDFLLHFLATQTLNSMANNEEIVMQFMERGTNHDALAFRIWSGGALRDEITQSSVTLMNKRGDELGSFSLGVSDEMRLPKALTRRFSDSLKTIALPLQDDMFKTVVSGSMPLRDGKVIVGYLLITLIYDKHLISSHKIPPLFETRENRLNDVINPDDLNIFSFLKGRLEEVDGKFAPSNEQTFAMLNAVDPETGEGWLQLTVNEEQYITYVLRTDLPGGERHTAVSLREKELTWNFFNFFKLFIIHAIIILAFSIVVFFINFKTEKEAFYSFRSQLLIAFLIISILPIVALAVYNRENIASKSQVYLKNTLEERLDFVYTDVAKKIVTDDRAFLYDRCAHVARATGINFYVYDGTELFFAPFENWTKSGLLPNHLNASAHLNMDLLGFNELFIKESIDSYSYYTFYKKVSFHDKIYVIALDNALNSIQTTFTTVDFDVFLFGVYSFGILLIIVVSTLIAEKISSPIRRLTKATGAIAHGDLSVELDNPEKGEIKDLISGFNQMTLELKRSQEEVAALERENAWKEMARQVAHEIKNPLTPMKLSVQHLLSAYRDKSPKFDNILEKVLSTMLKQIETLNQIASEFSRFARMPSFSIVNIDVIPIIREIVFLFKDERITIHFQTEIEKAVIDGDEFQFKRMLINFIRNSLQADASRFDISLSDTEKYYVILFKDNGSGISEDNQHKIFQANFTTKQAGMGLGLKLSKRFVEGIGGTLHLVETGSHGTTFRINLPKITAKKEGENG